MTRFPPWLLFLDHDLFDGKDLAAAMVPWFEACMDRVTEHH